MQYYSYQLLDKILLFIVKTRPPTCRSHFREMMGVASLCWSGCKRCMVYARSRRRRRTSSSNSSSVVVVVVAVVIVAVLWQWSIGIGEKNSSSLRRRYNAAAEVDRTPTSTFCSCKTFQHVHEVIKAVRSYPSALQSLKLGITTNPFSRSRLTRSL